MLAAKTLNDELSSSSSSDSDERSDMSSGDSHSSSSDDEDTEKMDVQQQQQQPRSPMFTSDGVPVKQPRYPKQHHRAQSEYYKEQIDQLLQADERMSEQRTNIETMERQYQARLWQHQRDLLHFEGWRQQNLPQPQLRVRSPVVGHFLQQQGDTPNAAPLDVDHVTSLLASYKCEEMLLKEALGQLKLVHGLVQFPRYGNIEAVPSEHNFRPYAVVVALDIVTRAVLFYIVHPISL